MKEYSPQHRAQLSWTASAYDIHWPHACAPGPALNPSRRAAGFRTGAGPPRCSLTQRSRFDRRHQHGPPGDNRSSAAYGRHRCTRLPWQCRHQHRCLLAVPVAGTASSFRIWSLSSEVLTWCCRESVHPDENRSAHDYAADELVTRSIAPANSALPKGALSGFGPSGHASHRALLPGARPRPMHGHACIMPVHASAADSQALTRKGSSTSLGGELV